MKPSELSALLARTIPAGLPVLIKGAPGVGKTDIVRGACESAGADLLISHPVVSDPTDYKGLPAIVDGQAEFLPFGDLRLIMSADRLTVCFLDDLGQAPQCVQAAAMQLILARRVNGHTVSDSVTFLAATNRRTDRAGVTGILEPVKSRYCTIIGLESDLDDWCGWALANNVPPELVAFVRFRPALLHDFKPTSDIVNSPCPRTVANVGRLLQAGIAGFEPIAGAAGEGFATEFIGFLQIWRKLPSPDAVLLNPDTADVPTDPATLYAICGALAVRASDQTAGRLLTYARRMPAEFGVLLVRDSIRKAPEVQNCAEFIRWASDNQDILV